MSTTEAESLLEAYTAGAAITELAASIGVHEQTVRGVIRRAGVPLRDNKLTADEARAAVELYHSGFSIREVAQQLGRAESSINNVLHQTGVELRPPLRRWVLSESQLKQAERWYRGGESLATVASRLEVAAETVRRALLRRGVTLRPSTKA